MTWKVISVFQEDFGNPPSGINIFGGGDQSTVEERKQLIADHHAKGTHHYWYCGVNSCPTVALSHETDHALCRPSFCSIIKNYHDTGNHGNCSTYWCKHKYWMDVEHAKGMHDELRCRPDPSSCLDLYESHKTDHKLCRPVYCDLVRKLHNGYDDNGKRTRKEDHSLCHEYWCDTVANKKKTERTQKLHDSGDHSSCDRNINYNSSCSFIQDLHQNGDHDLCHGTFCKDKSIIDAHARGGHSQFCLEKNCPTYLADTVARYHANGNHSVFHCNPDTCDKMKQSHETDHLLCPSDAPWCDYAKKKYKLLQWLKLDPDA